MSRFEREVEYPPIPTSDGKFIHSRYTKGDKDNPHILIIPGNNLSPGVPDGVLRDVTKQLAENDFSTVRMNLHHWTSDARPRTSISLRTCRDDIEATIAEFREKGVEEFGIVGHSLAGLAIMGLSKQLPIQRAVLLDPSHTDSGLFKGAEYNSQYQVYYSETGDFVCSEELKEEIDGLDSTKLSKKYTIPTRLISAGDNEALKLHHPKYAEHSPGIRDYGDLVVTDGDHNFINEAHRQRVASLTVAAFQLAS